MRGIRTLMVASLGVVVATACGSSTTGSSDGGGDGSTGGSSGSSSGGSSSGTASSSGSSSGSSGSGSSSGGRDAGPLTATNDCPNCPGTQVCCLASMGTNVQGTCAANVTACPSGSAPIECAAEMDCNTGQTCCVMGGSAGSPASATCQTSCSGGSPGCGGATRDNVDCPGGGAGWACMPIPGTPQAVLGKCVPVEGGSPPESGAPDTGPPDAEGGTPPQDAATDGG
jgi:hypothetical protein